MATKMKKRSAKERTGARSEVHQQNVEGASAPARREPVILKIKVGADAAKYKALVSDYFAYGVTAGSKEAVSDVLARMSAARADLTDSLKHMIASVADNVVAASESGAMDVGVAVGTLYSGEHFAVMVKVHRVTHPRATSKWWGVVYAMFKGFDGHKTQSRHIVRRHVEFYTDKIDRDKLYRVLYEAARIVFNAYGRLKTPTS